LAIWKFWQSKAVSFPGLASLPVSRTIADKVSIKTIAQASTITAKQIAVARASVINNK
jgi:hypothetical protein